MSLRIRNIDNYNTNPNICKKCGKPILANYDDRLSNIKRKTFCSSSCAASYNNKIREIDHDGIQYNSSCKLDDFSDEYIINAFSESSSIVEFARKLGYKRGVSLNSKRAKSRLEMLNINLLGTILQQLIFLIPSFVTAYVPFSTSNSKIFSISNLGYAMH